MLHGATSLLDARGTRIMANPLGARRASDQSRPRRDARYLFVSSALGKRAMPPVAAALRQTAAAVPRRGFRARGRSRRCQWGDMRGRALSPYGAARGAGALTGAGLEIRDASD